MVANTAKRERSPAPTRPDRDREILRPKSRMSLVTGAVRRAHDCGALRRRPGALEGTAGERAFPGNWYITWQTDHAYKASSRRHRIADGLKGTANSLTAPARDRDRKRFVPPTWCDRR